MPNETPFPSTRQDVSNLKQTAVDAANDLGSTAAAHASKAKGQLRDLAGHAQEESADQLNQLRSQVNDFSGTARDYVSTRPLTCLGIALAVGFLFGLSRRA